MIRNILLNPGPATTTDTVKQAQVVPDICPREEEFGQVMQEIQRDLLKIVHVREQEYAAVLFCGSGTLCMDVCLNSLLPAGKKILIVNNGAYSARAAEICSSYGLPALDLKFPVNELPDLKMVEKELNEDTDIALVYTTHQETGTGILNPIREIGALAHAHGALMVADTTSTLALRPFSMEEENLDFCMASAQKGIQGMAGLSFVIGRKVEIEKSEHYPRRSYYCNLFLQYDYFQKTGQMHFTPPVQTIYAARQALKEYFAEGEQEKWNRHQRVMKAIHEGLEELGFQEVIPRENQAGLVATVRYPMDPNWNFEKVHDYCQERGFTIYPGKMQAQDTFRLCALGAIDLKDIEDFFHVFRQGLEREGISFPIHYTDGDERL